MKSKTFTDIMNESIDALERLIADEDENIKKYRIKKMPWAGIMSTNAKMKHQATIDAYKFSIQVFNTTEAYKG